MRSIAHEYYLKNGSLTGIQDSDFDVDAVCYPTNFYNYWTGNRLPNRIDMVAERCTGGGRNPNTNRRYYIYLRYFPASGQDEWHCYYQDDSSPCFGMPP